MHIKKEVNLLIGGISDQRHTNIGLFVKPQPLKKAK